MIQERSINQYVRGLARLFRPEKIILFGSHARGCATRDSDVDLLVIMNHDKARNIDQAVEMRLSLDASFPLDLLVRRPKDISERLSEKDTFIAQIMASGRVLYG
jgi:predicted nucleotidyltransferase